MKKIINFVVLFVLFFIIYSDKNYAAIVLGSKDDAQSLSKKSNYSTVLDDDTVNLEQQVASGVSIQQKQSSKAQVNEQTLDSFSAQKASKSGDTYTNKWSDYNITFSDSRDNARDYYDFNDSDMVFDFAVEFKKDYSRLAVYYTRLSRTIDQIALRFAEDNSAIPTLTTVGGNQYKHVQKKQQFPYGIDYYDYYLRDVDGKLMVIECFSESSEDSIAKSYIEKFIKNS